MPMIGLTPAAVPFFQNSYAPKTLPWSVIASAGMPIRAASVNRSDTRAAPSSMEYSLCTCRCTNCSAAVLDDAGSTTWRSDVGPLLCGDASGTGRRGKAAEMCRRSNTARRHFRRVGPARAGVSTTAEK